MITPGTRFPAIAGPGILLLSTIALIAATLFGTGLPGLGYEPVSLLGMAQLAFVSGIIMSSLPLRDARPLLELAVGAVLAATVLLQAFIHNTSGPGHPVAEGLELIYFWGLAAASVGHLLKCVMGRASFRGAACGVAGLLLVGLQLPAHSLFAAPAAEAIYSHPKLLASGITHDTDLAAIGLKPLDASMEGILRPVEIAQAAQRLQDTGQVIRHSWFMPNPLPNLPGAELLVVYDSLGTTPEVWVLPPQIMVSPGIPFILLHYALTSISVLLLVGPALFLRHREKISPKISRSERMDASQA